MSIIVEGTLHSAVLLAVMSIMIYYWIESSKTKQVYIRRLVALDAIEEAVGRAVEMGRPVAFGTGWGGMIDQYAPHTLAALSIMSYTADLCAKLNCQMFYIASRAHVIPAAQETMELAYRANNEVLDTDYAIRYSGDNQRALMTLTYGTFERERPACVILAGAIFWEALTIPDYGHTVGAINIGAGARMYAFPYLVTNCDYTLLGEELFAAGAYLSRDFAQVGSIKGQDWSKAIVILLVILGLLASIMDPNIISQFLSS
jgi:hypothetical protein